MWLVGCKSKIHESVCLLLSNDKFGDRGRMDAVISDSLEVHKVF